MDSRAESLAAPSTTVGDEKSTGVQTPATLEEAKEQPGTPPGDAAPTPSERNIKGVKWFFIVIGIYLTAFLYGLDTTIAADVQGPVLESLGHIELLPWIGIGFPLGSVSIILLVGSLYSHFEMKYLYLAGLVLFEVGSAICGAAPNMNAMIVGRVIAGMGGAGIYLGGLNYFGVLTTLQERALYIAGIGLFWGTGCILGPVIGGAFSSSSATWRWSFYINLVLAAVTAPIYIFLFPRFNFQPDVPVSKKLRNIDWVGFILNAAIFNLFIVALSFAGSQWRWNSPGTIILFVLEVVALVAFFVQQAYCIFTTKSDRLFPIHYLKRRSMVLLFLATALDMTGSFYTIYYVPIFFQFTKGDSAIDAAVRLLPFICLFIVFIMLSGALLPVVGRYAPAYLLSGIFFVIGGALMYIVTPTTSTSSIYGYEVLLAIGAGITTQSGYTIAAAKVPPEEVGFAIGFINVAQIGSGAVTLAVSGSIFQNLGVYELGKALAAYDFPRSELANALAGVQSQILEHGSPEVRNLAVGAIVKTISLGYAMAFSAGAAIIVASLAMRWERLQLNPTAAGG